MVHSVSRMLEFDIKQYKTPFNFAVEQLDNLAQHKVTVGGGTGGDNAFYGGVSMGEAAYFEYPCHVHMNNEDMPEDTNVVWSKWVIPQAALHKKQSETYFDWITSSSSPWKYAFDCGMSFNDPKMFCKDFWWDKGFIFDRLDNIPSNVLHNFLVASRMPKEWPAAIKLWYKIHSGGVSPEMALVLSTLFFTEAHNTVNFQLLYRDPYDWFLDAVSGDEEYVKNFLNHKMDRSVFNAPYSKSHSYTPVNLIWGNSGFDGRGEGRVTGDRWYGKKNYNQLETSILANLYAKDFGTIMNGSSSLNVGKIPMNWTCKVEELIEIGKLEDKRLRG